MFRFVVLALAVAAVSAAPGLIGSPVVGGSVYSAGSPLLATRSLGYGAPLGYSGIGLRSGLIGSPLAASYGAPLGIGAPLGVGAPLAASYAAPIGVGAPLAASYGLGAPLAASYGVAAPLATGYAAGYGAYGLRTAAPLGLASSYGLGYGAPLLH